MDFWFPGKADEAYKAKHGAIVDDYSDAAAVRKPHGIVWVDGKEVANTLMCPHCGEHFVSRRGSGHRRTFCMIHEAVTCGKPQCDRCVDIYAQRGTLSGREF